MVVTGGNRQVYQQDYESIYSLVADYTVFVLVLMIAFVMGCYMRHDDAKEAFLNRHTDRIIHTWHSYNLPNLNW